MMRLSATFALLLAGCPAPRTGSQSPLPPAVAGAGCPAASDVYAASYLTHEDASDATGRTGWVLPLHDRTVDSIAGQPEYAAIDAATAREAGVPAAPTNLWLLTPGQAPCQATVGGYYSAVIDGPAPNITYGVALDGCAAPPADQQQAARAIAVVAEQAPTECQLVAPQPVAFRLGDTDAQKAWQRPTKQTPIPPALAAAIPAHDCRAPGCETLWAFVQVDVAGHPVAWGGTVNWLTVPPGATSASQCDWKAETFAGFFVPGPDGQAVRVTEGQDHPLLLSAVLADRSGARVLIAEGPGEYSTYELVVGAARLGRHLVWMRMPAEDYAVDDRIGPTCDPAN